MVKMTRTDVGTNVYNIYNFMSSSRRGRKYVTEGMSVDTSLALAFYNFLTEGSNKLPSLEYVNKVIESSNYDCVSDAYGVVVNIEKGEEDYILVIELSIPINDRRIRVDKISCDKHIIYLDFYSKMNRVEIDPDNTKVLSKTVDIDKKRIKFLQNYLSKLQIKKEVKVNRITK